MSKVYSIYLSIYLFIGRLLKYKTYLCLAIYLQIGVCIGKKLKTIKNYASSRISNYDWYNHFK